jgi:uncharacterized protein
MTKRLTVEWPDRAPFRDRGDKPIRILAASDEADPHVEVAANREALGQIDLVIGCGDLAPDRLCFLADAFRAPLVYVRGNHDRGGPWPQPRMLPVASAGVDEKSLPGIRLLALPWPTLDPTNNRKDEGAAWRQVIRLAGGRLVRSTAPYLVISHVPPEGAGDTPSDYYHRGFGAYRLLLDRMKPPLWLHGHTTLAARPNWHERHRDTTLINVTGATLVELVPPGSSAAS